jgi:hypothetical protein
MDKALGHLDRRAQAARHGILDRHAPTDVDEQDDIMA